MQMQTAECGVKIDMSLFAGRIYKSVEFMYKKRRMHACNVYLNSRQIFKYGIRSNNDAENYFKTEASGNILSATVMPPLAFISLWRLFKPRLPTTSYPN